jgi:ubiquinone biosynthesis protein Coq4
MSHSNITHPAAAKYEAFICAIKGISQVEKYFESATYFSKLIDLEEQYACFDNITMYFLTRKKVYDILKKYFKKGKINIEFLPELETNTTYFLEIIEKSNVLNSAPN